MGSFTAPPISVTSLSGARSAELVFAGIDQAGPSFEGRVFLNNTNADENTPLVADAGYAGAFHVYGYGRPLPPAVAEVEADGQPGDAPVAPIEKRLRLSVDTLRAAIGELNELSVTVVPIPVDPGGPRPERPVDRVDLRLGTDAPPG